MTSQEPEKKTELDAMMKRLGLLGIDSSKEPRPGGPGGEGRAGKSAEPQLSPPISPGKGQADELKDFLRHLETLEKEGAKKIEGLASEGDSVMARLEKLDLAGIQEEARTQPAAQPRPVQAPSQPVAEPAPPRAQAPKKEDDFVALIRGIEEVKRDMVPESAGKPVVRREIKAEKLTTAAVDRKEKKPAPQEEAGAGEPEYASVLDRLQKLDLSSMGGETKTDLDDIAAWKKDLRKDAKAGTPAPRETAAPLPSQVTEGVDTESILKRLEGLTPPAGPEAAAQKVVKAVPREAAPPQPLKAAAQPPQAIDADAILKRLEELTPEEAKAVAQKVAPAPSKAPPQPAKAPKQPSQGVDAETILRRLEGPKAQAPKEAAPGEPADKAPAGLEGIAPADQRVAGRSKWEAVAPPKGEPKARAAPAPGKGAQASERAQAGTGKDGSEKDVTSVIDTIFKVHKGAPMGAPNEDVDASLKQIIEEETKAGAAVDEEKEATHAKKTRWSEGEQEEGQESIVSVDEIKDISNLILPKGATFAIDEVKLHERTAVFDVKTGAVPSEIVESWQSQLPTGVIKDIVIGKEAGEETKPKGLFGRLNIMKVIRKEVEEYNPRIHGPLVDLAFRPAPNIEEVEVYPVNEPYAFIRVLHDNSTHEYTYQVLEPVLNPAEKDLVGELKQRLFETLEVNTKDLTKEAAHKAIRGAVDTVLSDYGIS
ncbi:MAG: hypothetical protein LUQ49_01585, partial [Methanomicrobiales archaeon]|nr:hypothetical protein [Methanomicrobiales archaeon]